MVRVHTSGVRLKSQTYQRSYNSHNSEFKGYSFRNIIIGLTYSPGNISLAFILVKEGQQLECIVTQYWKVLLGGETL